MKDAFAATAKTIASLAAQDYAAHVVTEIAPSEWKFHKPGTGIMASVILARPGAVIVYGDVGEWILRPSDSQALPWLRGSIRSRDYLLEKVRAGDVERFYPADAIAELQRVDAKDEHFTALRATVREAIGECWGDEPTEYEWRRAWADAGETEPPSCRYPSESGLWLHETLSAFIRTLDAA